MGRTLILYNVKAGHGTAEKKIESLSEVFENAGWDITSKRIVFGDNPLEGENDLERVIVCGGDGTINYILNSMKTLSLDIPIGIIPMGTANDFAGAVGMSKKPIQAATQILNGHIEELDCGRVNDLYFINIFSFGLFTTTSQHTPDALKHKIGKIAYMLEGSKELLHCQTMPLTIRYDGIEKDVRGLVVLIFNGETAGRFRLARKASIRDGVLECIVMKKCNPIGGAWAMVNYLIHGRKNFAIDYFRTSSLEIVSTSDIRTDMDGQKGADFPLHIQCIRGGVKVICPPL